MSTLAADFAVADPDELVELGVFLLKRDARTLELVFRGGAGRPAVRGGRVFSAHPADPTGTAGRAFVSGDVVRVPRDSPVFARGLEPSAVVPPRTRGEGVVSLPMLDWQAGGIPYGVVYLAVSRTDGAIFGLPANPTLGGGKSVGDLAVWMQTLAADLISSLTMDD